jgi:hypothetical protein
MFKNTVLYCGKTEGVSGDGDASLLGKFARRAALKTLAVLQVPAGQRELALPRLR